MPNTLEHERHRFSTMSVKQLYTRLGKITDREKLRNFICVCIEHYSDQPNTAFGKILKRDFLRLARVAREKLRTLFNEIVYIPYLNSLDSSVEVYENGGNVPSPDFEDECEKAWLESENKKVPIKREPKKPKEVIDILPSRKIRLD
jgi:hypothetical protein